MGVAHKKIKTLQKSLWVQSSVFEFNHKYLTILWLFYSRITLWFIVKHNAIFSSEFYSFFGLLNFVYLLCLNFFLVFTDSLSNEWMNHTQNPKISEALYVWLKKENDVVKAYLSWELDKLTMLTCIHCFTPDKSIQC